MAILAIFILGFSFHYIINMAELLTQLFEANIALKITKINSQIGEWTTHEPYKTIYSADTMCEKDGWEDDWEDDDFID